MPYHDRRIFIDLRAGQSVSSAKRRIVSHVDEVGDSLRVLDQLALGPRRCPGRWRIEPGIRCGQIRFHTSRSRIARNPFIVARTYTIMLQDAESFVKAVAAAIRRRSQRASVAFRFRGNAGPGAGLPGTRPRSGWGDWADCANCLSSAWGPAIPIGHRPGGASPQQGGRVLPRRQGRPQVRAERRPGRESSPGTSTGPAGGWVGRAGAATGSFRPTGPGWV